MARARAMAKPRDKGKEFKNKNKCEAQGKEKNKDNCLAMARARAQAMAKPRDKGQEDKEKAQDKEQAQGVILKTCIHMMATPALIPLSSRGKGKGRGPSKGTSRHGRRQMLLSHSGSLSTNHRAGPPPAFQAGRPCCQRQNLGTGRTTPLPSTACCRGVAAASRQSKTHTHTHDNGFWGGGKLNSAIKLFGTIHHYHFWKSN